MFNRKKFSAMLCLRDARTENELHRVESKTVVKVFQLLYKGERQIAHC
jgi:hypothetical protein